MSKCYSFARTSNKIRVINSDIPMTLPCFTNEKLNSGALIVSDIPTK